MSGPIPDEILAEIIRRANIVEVINEHLPLRKVGSGYQGICPFHTDSKPSLNVNEAKQFFYCFGCGAGGNAFHFLMRIHHMSFPEAVRLLAGRYGVQIPERPLAPEERKRRELRETLLEINERALAFYRDGLRGIQGEGARRYLEHRGISPETQEEFSLGFAPAAWQGLVEHFRHSSISLKLAEQAGLIIPGKERGYYDRFRGRIIFPIHDERGGVIGFGGRTMGDELPKYINSPDSPIFAKRRNLYGLHKARGVVREADAVVVVEGYTDLLGLHQFGVRHAVATLGTALTVDHLKLLRRFTSNVIHIFDADEAGERATLRSLDLCLEVGIWGQVLSLPHGQDPDSFIREVGGESFRKELAKAIPLIDFWIQRVISKEDVSRLQGKMRALEQILPRLRRLSSQVAIDHYVALTAECLGIAEHRIREMLRGAPKAVRQQVEESTPSDPHRAEKLLLLAVLKEPSLASCLGEDVLEEFQDSHARELGAKLARWAGESGNGFHTLEANIQNPELAQTLASLMAALEEVGDAERVCEDCLRHLKRKGLERKIQTVDRAIAQARGQRDDERVRALEEQKIDLVLQKARLRMSA